MKEEEKIKLELGKLEGERGDYLIFTMGILAAFISIAIPLLINARGFPQILIGLLLILVLWAILRIFNLKRKTSQNKINELYNKLLK